MLTSLRTLLCSTFKDAMHVSFDFFKVLISIIIGLKILTELHLIRYLALPLEPLMQLTGLPPDLGIAWATGIMVNFYSALIVLVSLLPNLPPLTTAQMTTFGLMILIAHSLPAEGRIAAQCGVSFLVQCVIRLVVAVIGGLIVFYACQTFGWLNSPASIVFSAQEPDRSLFWWAVGEARNMASIFCIIFAVMLLQTALRHFRVADIIGSALAPFLRVLGMGPAAATTVLVGMVTGILYGSGIIIQESRCGRLTRHEVFFGMTLMGLAHAIIEDTCLMLLIGAHIGGIFFLRLALAFGFCALLNFLYLRFRRPPRQADAGELA